MEVTESRMDGGAIAMTAGTARIATRRGADVARRRRRPWLLDLYRSSFGKKYVMAVTGLILMAQPYRAYVKTLLERQHYPGLHESTESPADRPYDVTGWTLPAQMGVDVRVVDAPFVRFAHRHGLQVHVWTIDNPADIAYLVDLDVDGIMTDRVDVLLSAMSVDEVCLVRHNEGRWYSRYGR